MSYLHNIDRVSDEERRLREGLEAKRLAAIERLGTKWLLHPSNAPKKTPTPVCKLLEGASHG